MSAIGAMSGLIITVDEPELKSIVVQTRRGNSVQNHQGVDISRLDLAAVEGLKKEFPGTQVRSRPSPIYNCHGLTFASRRTRIPDSAEVARILREDDYTEIVASELLVGDIAIYYRDGDLRHSGVVVELQKLGSTVIPRILSKWGSGFEAVHRQRECPYMKGATVRYFRIEE